MLNVIFIIVIYNNKGTCGILNLIKTKCNAHNTMKVEVIHTEININLQFCIQGVNKVVIENFYVLFTMQWAFNLRKKSFTSHTSRRPKVALKKAQLPY